MRFLCLVTNKVISEAQLRRTRHNVIFAHDPNKWSQRAMDAAKARKIHDTPRPEVAEGQVLNGCGYEERDGELYQTWMPA